MDYDDGGGAGALIAWLVLAPFLFLLAIAGYVIGSWFLMKIFEKAGVQGKWRAWVPVYNTLIFVKLGDLNPWWLLVLWGGGIVLGWVPVHRLAHRPRRLPLHAAGRLAGGAEAAEGSRLADPLLLPGDRLARHHRLRQARGGTPPSRRRRGRATSSPTPPCGRASPSQAPAARLPRQPGDRARLRCRPRATSRRRATRAPPAPPAGYAPPPAAARRLRAAARRRSGRAARGCAAAGVAARRRRRRPPAPEPPAAEPPAPEPPAAEHSTTAPEPPARSRRAAAACRSDHRRPSSRRGVARRRRAAASARDNVEA